MANDPSPLKVMGPQSPQTVHLAAAMAHTVGTTERGDQVMRRLSRELERAGIRGFAEDRRLADAVGWAVEKAADVLRAAARQLRRQAVAAVGRPIRDDPVRSVLVAAGIGAALMLMVSMSAKSGARKLERRARG